MINRRSTHASKIFPLGARGVALSRAGIPHSSSVASKLKDVAPNLKHCSFGALLLLGLLGSSINIGHAADLELRDTHNAFIETYEISTNSGIAIAIKDNIDIAGRVTSAGSLAMAENVARTDAYLIEKLRDEISYCGQDKLVGVGQFSFNELDKRLVELWRSNNQCSSNSLILAVRALDLRWLLRPD